jgi:hypothetical protein
VLNLSGKDDELTSAAGNAYTSLCPGVVAKVQA